MEDPTPTTGFANARLEMQPELLLTAEEMGRADSLAVAAGVASLDLMETAGAAIAEEIARRFTPRRAVVLTGPGNNGGDGWVAARHLAERGWDVRVAFLTAREKLKGDAATMAGRYHGPVEPLAADMPVADLIVDGLFGAGLARPLEGAALSLARTAKPLADRIVAIDVPSGLDGTTGEPRGDSFRAALTVTFFRRKPGHLLMPGRARCGEVVVRDIGIPDSVLEEIKPKAWVNTPSLWRQTLPAPDATDHKYTRGHTIVVSGGPWTTGASRLVARGALRVGSGAVTIASPSAALPIHAAHLTAIMLTACDRGEDLARLLADARKNAVVLGPGCGVGDVLKDKAVMALRSPAAVVLDADAITSFAEAPDELFALGRDKLVMTPHVGEFSRLFPGLLDGDPRPGRLEAAREAARRSQAVVVLKGADTVVAAPDGRASINESAPPWLATAGSGDVLAGFICGLMAQGMPAFEAASAGVWLHGAAAAHVGRGLIAEDLPEALPAVFAAL
jgi:hydroxyethylthiazole kinase-like uncharacterized protein yjeF